MKSKDFSLNEYTVIHEISKVLVEGENFQSDLRKVLEILKERMGLTRGMVSILFRDAKEICVDVTIGFDRRSKEVRHLLGEGIIGRVIAEGRPIAILNIEKEPLFLDLMGRKKNHKLSEISFVCVPIRFRNNIVGAISVDRFFSPDEAKLSRDMKFIEEVASLIASRASYRQMVLENTRLKNSYEEKINLNFVGNSDCVKSLKQNIKRVADSNTSVLITGETGTGKEVVAREVHELSPRKNAPMITINCGAIPENLIESELFGHEKGAFTGALQLRIGKFEQAKGGTIFLDEIGELPASAQVKLLRVLQEKELERIGGSKTIKVNVRVLAATNRLLEDEIEEGKFRSDLYYRLNVFPIHVPPLRERGADIMLLADYFVQKQSEELNKKIDRIDTVAIDMLMAYHWPGNVRELENTIERAVILSDDFVIHGRHLPPSLQLKNNSTKVKKSGKFEILVHNYEKELITEALKECFGNQTKAAQLLGTTKRVVQYKISRLKIDYKLYSHDASGYAHEMG